MPIIVPVPSPPTPSTSALLEYLTLQEIVDPLRTYPELSFLTASGGFSLEPCLYIANSVVQRMLAQMMNWKWNRESIPTFLTISLQQDYVTNVTDLGWLEQGRRIDINNTANPKPIFALETFRDIGQSSFQGNPFNVSWIPNTKAIMGEWQALTAYGAGYGQASAPASPITQFIDANGNILFIDSNSLGLSINSDGYSGTPISTTPPYGTSGSSEPSAALAASAGTTVVDGTVTWTVADPNGFAIRTAPIPASSGLCWLMDVVYQKKPPRFTSLADTINPIPTDLSYLVQQGFLAMAMAHSPEPSAIRKAPQMYAKWEQDLVFALRGADRERDDSSFYPSESLSGGGPFTTGLPVGPAYPYLPYY